MCVNSVALLEVPLEVLRTVTLLLGMKKRGSKHHVARLWLLVSQDGAPKNCSSPSSCPLLPLVLRSGSALSFANRPGGSDAE